VRADPGREDHDHFRSWVGGTFDPAAFDFGWSTPGCSGCADKAGWSGGFAAAAGLGGTEPEAVGAGLDDVGVERDPVDDGGDQAGVGDDGAPLIWGWLMFVLKDLYCLLGSCHLSGFLIFEVRGARMLGATLILQV
jgi:hypothetical protein